MKIHPFHLLLALLFFVLPPCHAIEKHDPVTLTFLPPELDGRFSMGIYDFNGKLVRVLHCDAPASAFRAGLNGLITQWDGNDDKGNSLPAGEYVARGYVVGDAVDVEGEAFHFNDWTGREDVPSIQSIADFRASTDGDLVVIADTLVQGRILGRVDEEKGFLWIQRVAPDASIIAVNSKEIFLAGKGEWMARSLTDGSAVGSLATKAEIGAATDSHLFVLAGQAVRALRIKRAGDALEFEEDKQMEIPALPFAVQTASGFADGWWTGNGKDDCLLWKNEGDFSRVSLTPLNQISRLSAGNGISIWALGVSEGEKEPVVAQFNTLGEALHVLTAEPGWTFVNIAASSTEECLLIEDRKGNERRIRALHHNATAEKTADSANSAKSHWTVAWERKLLPCADFGIVAGKLVPDAGNKAAPNVIKIPLQKNPLEPDTDPSILLSAQVTPEGSWLATADGLPLVRVSAQLHLTRGCIAMGEKPHEARFFQGNAGVVEEFRVSGLDHIAAFDCGSFELSE